MSDSFKSFIGDNTPVVVEFDYTPEQVEILNPPDNAQPGYPAEVEITAVLVNDVDVSEDLSSKCMERLKDGALEYIEECRREC